MPVVAEGGHYELRRAAGGVTLDQSQPTYCEESLHACNAGPSEACTTHSRTRVFHLAEKSHVGSTRHGQEPFAKVLSRKVLQPRLPRARSPHEGGFAELRSEIKAQLIRQYRAKELAWQ